MAQATRDESPSTSRTSLNGTSESLQTQKRPKNMKKLSLSTANAQRLLPTFHISSSLPSTPHSATIPRKSPPKLPALNMGFLGVRKRPSMPLLNDSDILATPIDPTFKLVRELQGESSIEADHEGNDIDPYKDGPVCIIPPNLWLYSEPTKAEAQQFDVIINVAHEIENPLRAGTPIPHSDFPIAHPESQARWLDLSSPESCGDSSSSNSASESSVELSGSPQSEVRSTFHGKIEYIHMPWQHNQALAGDLPLLTNLIDRRIGLANKKVLVHCQQGVSRSASLVVAYIMKARSMNVNEAYAFVKEKSPWIGPNMSLIYQLCEWGELVKRTSQESQAHRRSFEIGGPRTAPSSGRQDFQAQQRRRATSSADRGAMERAVSDTGVGNGQLRNNTSNRTRSPADAFDTLSPSFQSADRGPRSDTDLEQLGRLRL